MRKEKFNPHLLRIIKTEISHEIAASRKPVLDELVKYINSKRASESEVHLNFICTHNSRRSQFCQIWAETASAFYNKKVYSYSGGLEITEFNINAVNTIKKCGFDVIKSEYRDHVREMTNKHHEVIEIKKEQLLDFCGNCLEVLNKNGELLLAMSSRAFNSYSDEQKLKLAKHFNKIVHSDMPTIEKYGGGSARCMIAELF